MIPAVAFGGKGYGNAVTRPFLFFALLLALAGIPSSVPFLRPIFGNSNRIAAEPVPFDPADSARRTAGALTYLGGLRLSSADSAFGGYSAMLVDGDRFLLLSDGGNVLRFRMGADLRPREVRFGDLPAGPGSGVSKGDRDSESITRDAATGQMWVGYENANAIWRYDAALARAERWAVPPAMAGWPSNGGPEAMVRLRGGGTIVLAETMPGEGSDTRMALRFAGDPTEAPDRGFIFSYRPPAGYDPSDMTELPDGRLLVLNRRMTPSDWFTAKLVLIDPAAVRKGAVVAGREVATIGRPFLRDNFEALAATREGGATIVWIASDDNRQWPEQTLLMKFRLDLR